MYSNIFDLRLPTQRKAYISAFRLLFDLQISPLTCKDRSHTKFTGYFQFAGNSSIYRLPFTTNTYINLLFIRLFKRIEQETHKRLDEEFYFHFTFRKRGTIEKRDFCYEIDVKM